MKLEPDDYIIINNETYVKVSKMNIVLKNMIKPVPPPTILKFESESFTNNQSEMSENSDKPTKSSKLLISSYISTIVFVMICVWWIISSI